MRQEFAAIQNRRIYKRLTVETLAKIADEHLEQAIIDYIMTKVEPDPEREREIVSEMSEGLRATFTTWLVVTEVENGGFNQFYFNSSRQHGGAAESGFAFFGEMELAALMKEANAIHRADEARVEAARANGTIDAFMETYDNDPYAKLDDAFFALSEGLGERRVRFIRQHPGRFVGP